MTDRDGANIGMLKEFDQLPFENKVILTGKSKLDDFDFVEFLNGKGNKLSDIGLIKVVTK
ncbi:DUF1919 domain-containing protein [Limosilactobacillus walteri]|uniref:DUF1919 domain-containing protein n=1 Tax=Limosilactobacillus walteri TaxID=2268022 RepID=UPI001785DD23